MNFIFDKIGSISDVITNSSSEVFVMNRTDADSYNRLPQTFGNIEVTEIGWSFLNELNYEWQMVCTVCDIDDTIIRGHPIKTLYGERYASPALEDWQAFLELYHDIIQEKLIGKYYVRICNHFDSAMDVIESAYKVSIFHESD